MVKGGLLPSAPPPPADCCAVAIMDVMRRTFQALLPRMLQAVETADFVAIDTELTGAQRASARARARGLTR